MFYLLCGAVWIGIVVAALVWKVKQLEHRIEDLGALTEAVRDYCEWSEGGGDESCGTIRFMRMKRLAANAALRGAAPPRKARKAGKC